MTLSRKHVQRGSKLRLLLDDQIFHLQPFGGISTYWHELKAGLAANQARYDLIKSKPIVRIQPARAPGAVFHSSYYRFATGRGSRTVTTVHDLIPERGIAPSAASRLFTAYRKALFRLSDAFICVSQQTKNDLLCIYPNECIHKPVYVAQHGNPRSSFVPMGEPLPQPSQPDARERTFLFVGNREGYKSFDVAIDAFALSKLWSEGYRLVCSGAPISPREHKMLKKRGVDRFVSWTGRIETKELFKLYAKSLALLYPSSYEGFGLPIVEAMTFGCIPLVADLDPMRSIVGKLLPTVQPGNAYALRDLMVDITTPGRGAEISVGALKRADDFHWSRSIDVHIALYQELGARVFQPRDRDLAQTIP